jgi:hypothetical protein
MIRPALTTATNSYRSDKSSIFQPQKYMFSKKTVVALKHRKSSFQSNGVPAFGKGSTAASYRSLTLHYSTKVLKRCSGKR